MPEPNNEKVTEENNEKETEENPNGSDQPDANNEPESRNDLTIGERLPIQADSIVSKIIKYDKYALALIGIAVLLRILSFITCCAFMFFFEYEINDHNILSQIISAVDYGTRGWLMFNETIALIYFLLTLYLLFYNHDPLYEKYNKQKICKPRRANIEDIPAIATIGDLCFKSKAWPEGKKGREDYCTKLFHQNNNIFWVLELETKAGLFLTLYKRFNKNIKLSRKTIIAYTSIIPEKPDTIKEHIKGKFNVYEINLNEIYSTDEKIKTDTLYFQAIATRQAYASLPGLDVYRDEKLLPSHLAVFVKQMEPKPEYFKLLAEEFTKYGKSFMQERGFVKTGIKAPQYYEHAHQNNFWIFDSSSTIKKEGKDITDRVFDKINRKP